jgi:acyl-CoA dehydrogenase
MPAPPPGAASDAMPDTRGLDFYREDPNLEFVCSTVMAPEVLERARPHLSAMGTCAGAELDALAAVADRNPPALRAWDQRGRRIDEIVFHPAYREMEQLAFSRFGLAAMSHRPGVLGWPGPVPHTVKYALSYLFAQSEFGLLCPVNVTDSTARMLRAYGSAELQAAFLPRLTATEMTELWQGTQWMTERAGGSDVGAATTVARRDGDGTWRLWGDKWFCSNANAELALTLARPEGAPAGTAGLAMFLVPRVLPDGARNAWTINRLKDKLGARSMASAEVTYAGAIAYPVGDPARGFRQMMEMVNVSRLSNAMRAAAIMRRCLLESLVHARGRAAFGRPLIELPLLRVNLLEMLLDVEAACSVVMNAAAALDRWDAGSAADRALFRILTPLAKGWTTARARVVAGEAMNIRGGNGYIEEWVNPRLLRDSYLGAIWEGATNVVCLDVQRAIVRDGGLEAVGGLVRARLATVVEPSAMPWRELVAEQLDAIRARAAAWSALPRAEHELEARPAAEALHHILAASLLLAEGQVLLDRMDSARKLLVGALYARRWLAPSVAGAPAYPAPILELLDTLARWEPIALDVLSELGKPL